MYVLIIKLMTMKTRLLIFSLLLFTLGASATPSSSASAPASPVASTASHETEKPALNVDRQLAYCHTQIHRALNELRQKNGSFNYAMEPRNILGQDKQKGWNCRPATAEEWCGGF